MLNTLDILGEEVKVSPKYVHMVKQLGIFRFGYFKLGKNFELSITISSNWDNQIIEKRQRK